MSDSVNILVLGNCQAQMLEGIVTLAVRGAKVERHPPVFELTEKDRDRLTASMQAADHIFLQRVSEDYVLDWFRPSRAREAFPGKVTVWPNIYFSGYFPDVEYIYTGSIGKLLGPLEDYHMRGVLNAHKAGQSATAAKQAILTGPATKAKDAFQSSIAELTSREKDVDVPISDFVMEHARARRCFYTPNHPYNFMLVEMARRLAAKVGLPFDQAAAEKWGYKLDKIYIPAYPSVIQSEGIVFDETQVYKGMAVADVSKGGVRLGGERSYSLDEILSVYYRIYDAVFARAA